MGFKPKDVPQLSPYMTVKDADKSIEFYEKAFGFKVTEAVKDDKGKTQHVSMKMDEVLIMFCPEGAYGTTKRSPKNLGVQMPINVYIYCHDVDKLYKQATDNGAESIVAPNDSFWGDRFCSVLDPDGYEWLFATMLKPL